jgi:tetratricopeptide (TPR) repeat protein
MLRWAVPTISGSPSVLILRIRQAETALQAGRLDEAYDLTQDADLRAHRRGQDLVGRLVEALVRRGQEHLAGQRWQQAFADARKAFKLGGNLPEISQLQAALAAAFDSRQHSQQREADAAVQAERCVRDGQLTMAEGLLEDADSDVAQTAALRRQAALRRGGADAALAEARAALDRQDWDAAIRAALDARRLHASDPRVAEIMTRAGQAVLAEIRASIAAGRIDRARILVDRLGPLTGKTLDLAELDRTVGQLQVAAERISQGRPRDVEQILRQLEPVLPKAGWLKDAIAAAQQASGAIEQLRTGPLGLVLSLGTAAPERTVLMQPTQDNRDDVTRRIAGAAPPLPEVERQPVPAGPLVGATGGLVPTAKPAFGEAGSASAQGENLLAAPCQGGRQGVPQRFLLHVDGVGSYLVVRSAKVTIGPASSSNETDVPLMAEPSLSAVTIERADEDYFLRSAKPVPVNERPVTQKLLTDGDRIALSSRCRVRFNLPNAASTSAVVQLSGTRLPGTDARRVILMNRELLIGPGPASHIRADGLDESVVLYVRDDRLCCRTNEPVVVNDTTLDGSRGLPLDASVRIGAISMVVKAVTGS